MIRTDSRRLPTAMLWLGAFLALVAMVAGFASTSPAAAQTSPTIELSKVVVNPDGDTITVTGTGFTPALGVGTRPPLAGVPSGVYIAFGAFADVWKPSEGAGSGARPTVPQAEGGVKWAVLEADRAIIGEADSVTLNPDGSFTATVNVRRYDGAIDPDNYGIYTYPGSGAIQPLFETFTPVTFTDDGAEPTETTAPETTTPAATGTPRATASATTTTSPATQTATTAAPTATPKPPSTGSGTAGGGSGNLAPVAGGLIALVSLAAAGSWLAAGRRPNR